MKVLRYSEADFLPATASVLAWRWVGNSESKLPRDAVDTIHALNPAAALALAQAATTLRKRLIHAHAESFDRPTESTAGDVGAWLSSLVPADPADVALSWDAGTAVITTWKTFTRYWSDFCYPSSDDVDVLPVTEDWLLEFVHADRFIFRRAR